MYGFLVYTVWLILRFLSVNFCVKNTNINQNAIFSDKQYSWYYIKILLKSNVIK